MASDDISGLKPVYLIWGGEPVLLERAEGRLRARFAAVADLDFNLDVFDGETADADAVVAAANTMPFMSERRLVIVRGSDKMHTGALNVLASYVEDPSPGTVLVLVASKVDKRTRLYRSVEACGQVSEYAAPKRAEYPSIAADMFEALGVRVTREGADALVEAVGTDLARLSSEVDKIAAYIGPETALGREDILEVVSKTAAVFPWALNDAIGTRDVEACLRIESALLNQGETVYRLNAMAVRHIRNMLAVKALQARGMSQQAVATSARLAPWQVRNLVRQADRFDAAELIEALRSAARSEAEMKTSPVEPGLVFERWIAAVCRATP